MRKGKYDIIRIDRTDKFDVDPLNHNMDAITEQIERMHEQIEIMKRDIDYLKTLYYGGDH